MIEIRTITQPLNPKDIDAVWSQPNSNQNRMKSWSLVSRPLALRFRLDSEFGWIAPELRSKYDGISLAGAARRSRPAASASEIALDYDRNLV